MQDFAAWLERKPAGKKPKRFLKRTVRPRQVSSKRRRANAEYTRRRRAYLETHPVCEAFPTIRGYYFLNRYVLPMDTPTGPQASSEIHHKRKPKCKYLNDESTWLAVCRWSHLWIEANKSTARALSLLD